MIKKGSDVAVPIFPIFPDRAQTRAKYGYDIGKVIATGTNKCTGKRGVCVRIDVKSSVWANRVTDKEIYDKWFNEDDVDIV